MILVMSKLAYWKQILEYLQIDKPIPKPFILQYVLGNYFNVVYFGTKTDILNWSWFDGHIQRMILYVVTTTLVTIFYFINDSLAFLTTPTQSCLNVISHEYALGCKILKCNSRVTN
ncbi:unnamed protein product [Owenia fusiformis]|uniref:Uncharacterized protein n=1 Tax=Owenia fusiformis TaxID=6347 RepID=A0A8S4PRB2_OWEFU|nr:unnamed protein product [Owenia fusiformis]